MYPRLIVSTAALLFVSALQSDAQVRTRTTAPIRFQEMDRDHDGVITRSEWLGTDQAFRMQDWNGDGVLSGDEVRLDADQRRPERDDHYYDTPEREYAFDNWTARRFDSLDRNRDGRIARKEWRLDRELFRRADRNRDNFLSRWEFLRVPQEVFSSEDINRDGVIEVSEWRGSRIAFDRRDLNRDGRLTRDEFAGSGSVGIPGDTPVGTSGSHSPAYSAGYGRGAVEARAQAREDRVRNQGYDPEGQRELETADSGYDPRFGPKAEYQAGYRDGWRRGYPEGWRQP